MLGSVTLSPRHITMKTELLDKIENLPDDFKKLLKSVKHQSPTSIFFSESVKNEATRQHIRENSVLYKHIFKEDIFSFVTSTGYLNLDIAVESDYDRRSLVNDIEREIAINNFIMGIFDELPQSRTSVTYGDGKLAYIEYKNVLEFNKLIELNSDLRDALKDLRSKSHTLSLVYINRERKELIRDINKLLSVVARRTLDIQNQHYISNSVKTKPVSQLVKSINWKAVFSKI